ncbi:MAG: Fur family transcriptional regulator [Neptuniibacter caesariensis]|uniref:Fur family transcriptional regulator n=1 Tax=Neptuniibacter caesariensis TaxID=207954 RepID=A0A2G6JPJ7_NEPCE|nr:MAG: Fur family transcriptional regulator [Neptuniibacter caesariensis]
MANHFPGFHSDHDHSDCIEHALTDARTLCNKRRLRFTPIRELVLKTIWQSHKPLGAYELLPTLADAGFNSAPPTVYRALEFLQEQGLVHRIALLNAFIGCPHPGEKHQGSFLICKLCNNTVEIDTREAAQVINAQASQLGFIPEQQAIEVLGICPECSAGNRS